jgi:hypothetical protein
MLLPGGHARVWLSQNCVNVTVLLLLLLVLSLRPVRLLRPPH